MVLQSLEQAENELAEFLGKMSDQEVCAAFNAAKRDAEPVLIRLILSAEIVNRNLEDELEKCSCGKYEQVGRCPTIATFTMVIIPIFWFSIIVISRY